MRCPKCNKKEATVIQDIPWDTVKRGVILRKGGTKLYTCRHCSYYFSRDYK